jgi:hypothetical protein
MGVFNWAMGVWQVSEKVRTLTLDAQVFSV